MIKYNKERGSLTLEASIVTPIFVILMLVVNGLFIMFMGQQIVAHTMLQSAKSLAFDPYRTQYVSTSNHELLNLFDDMFSQGNFPLGSSDHSSDVEWYVDGYTKLPDVIEKRFYNYLNVPDSDGDGDIKKSDAKQLLKFLGIEDLNFNDCVVEDGVLKIKVTYTQDYFFKLSELTTFERELMVQVKLFQNVDRGEEVSDSTGTDTDGNPDADGNGTDDNDSGESDSSELSGAGEDGEGTSDENSSEEQEDNNASSDEDISGIGGNSDKEEAEKESEGEEGTTEGSGGVIIIKSLREQMVDKYGEAIVKKVESAYDTKDWDRDEWEKHINLCKSEEETTTEAEEESSEGGNYSKYLEQLDGFSENKINHIINGSKGSNHGWENLVPDKNWDEIKNIIAEVMETGVEGPYKTVYSKKAIINGFEVEVTYTKLSDGTIKISDAWINQ